MPDEREQFMAHAVELSKQCKPSANAFSVGAIIVDANGEMISTGFSGELNNVCHAEEAAITKAIDKNMGLSGCSMYSTMEPCSIRLSGREPCCQKLIENDFSRVYFAVNEPSTFVQCKGVELLQANGIEVVQLSAFAPDVMEINSHLK